MNLTRIEASTKLPIPRKGTKYLARARGYIDSSVPVVIAVRDMIKLAKTSREVKQMIKDKLLKINGKLVKDHLESIKLFNLFEADKSYLLTLLPTRKFNFEEAKDKSIRLCKVINRRLVSDGKIQINMHDGTNLVSSDKIKVGDSLYIDFSNKIKKHISLEKGKEVFVMSGKYTGLNGKIIDVKDNILKIKFKENEADLHKSSVVAL